jgi:hypothetical protein
MVQVPPFTTTRAKLASALVAAVAAAILAWPAPAGAVEKGVMPDLTWGIRDSDFAPTQAAITDLGAKWVRLEFRWNEAEPQNNSYSATTLAEWDKAVATAQASGAKIIGMVHRSPSWASGSSNSYTRPKDPADYADFMRFVAARYKGKVAAWEIWNEENISRFWPTGPSPASYVKLLKAGYTAVKAIDPSALVVFGGVARNDYNFIEGAYANGAKGYFDVMATHPYSDQFAPDRVWYDGDYLATKTFIGYREVRRRMLLHGDDKPIWFTEMGWATCTTNPWCVSSAQQADYLTRAYCVLQQDPYVQVGIWYNLRNNHWDHDADSWETQLGLMTTRFELKPAYAAFKASGSAPCPALNLPAGSDPLDRPIEPEPAPEPTPEPTTDPAPEPSTEGEPEVVSSSVREHSRTLLRKSRLATASAATTTRRRAHKIVVFGHVKRADAGHVTVKVRRLKAGTAHVKVRSVRVHNDGSFRRVIRFRQDAHWRMRARYAGNATTYPSHSRILKFRT